jgi:hypothetical protein
LKAKFIRSVETGYQRKSGKNEKVKLINCKSDEWSDSRSVVENGHLSLDKIMSEKFIFN